MQGHVKTLKMLKSGRYAHLTDIITARRAIADEFGSHGVCRFYFASKPLLTGFQVMIFPVSCEVTKHLWD